MKKSYKFNVTGKNSNEVYTITFPDNLIKFIKYDFSAFAERSAELCKIALKSGRINREENLHLRNSILPCHRYLEKNLPTVFEKIVLDCWVEYICKQNEVNIATLWNSFAACRNEFEETLFARLCEFRYNHAANQWVTLLRIHEYATRKAEFIFGKKLENPAAAIAKAGLFDLTFNIAATELGCGELSTVKVYAPLRTPNSPFVMSGLSREIMRGSLKGINYETFDDTHLKNGAAYSNSPNMADKLAMDAFAAIKHALPEEADHLLMKSIPRDYERVYVPEGFKAVIDLEIDLLLENGAVMQKCGRCLEFFLRDEDYDHDYCSRSSFKSGVASAKTCLEIMSEKMDANKNAPQPVDVGLLHARCDSLYKEMAQRVNVDMNQRDFSEWYKGLTLIREKIASESATMDDFENFAEYSRTINFIPPKRRLTKPVEAEPTESVDGAKEYRFERVDSTTTTKPQVFDSGEVKTLAELYGIDLAEVELELDPAPLYPTTMFPPSQPQYTPPRYAPTSMEQPFLLPPPPSRIIRGVVPVGVKDLPQPVYEPPPLERLDIVQNHVSATVEPIAATPIAEVSFDEAKGDFMLPDQSAFEPRTAANVAQELL
ncbi:MAG: DUF6076 domain-containing protein, partial [Oscillospiraceae bacterium]|nr:DUF6076 domain-containing protein [Oscillospiraceae bacterium]